MKRSIGLWQLMGFAVTSLVGTILHFLYEWLNKSILVAPFSGVNESTWEHMKLIFWPMLIYVVIERFYFRDYDNFWCIKLRGIILGLIMIPIIFYTYNGVIGNSPDWINIAIFFISAAIAYIYETRMFNSNKMFCNSPKIAIIIISVLAILFILFTVKTPKFEIFKDPLSGSYGI